MRFQGPPTCPLETKQHFQAAPVVANASLDHDHALDLASEAGAY